jgi:hypothetical protein
MAHGPLRGFPSCVEPSPIIGVRYDRRHAAKRFPNQPDGVAILGIWAERGGSELAFD